MRRPRAPRRRHRPPWARRPAQARGRPSATPSTRAPRSRRRRWRPRRRPPPRARRWRSRCASGRSRVVSSTSDAARRSRRRPRRAPQTARGLGHGCRLGLGSGAGLRDARSAAVVSVVSDAATRWVWRFVVAAARPRDSALRACSTPTEVRAARAVLAASPRALAAFDDAAREAAVRFDAGFSDSSTGVGFASAALDAAFAGAASRLAAASRRCCAPAAACAPASAPSACVRRSSGRLVERGFAAVGRRRFAADGLDAPDLGARGFECRLRRSPRRLRGDRARRARGAGAPGALRGLRGARGATEDPRSADTPVPVPSGASSFCSERETEVTQTTYQSDPPNPVATSRRRRGSCAFPERGITIPLRPRSPARRATVGPDILIIRHNGVSICELPDERGGERSTTGCPWHPTHRRRCSDHPDRDSRCRHGEPARAIPPQTPDRAERRPHHHGPAVRQHRARVRRQRQRDDRRRLQARAHHRGVPAGVLRLQRGVRPDEHVEEPHARPRGVAVGRRALDERRRRVRPAHPRPGAAVHRARPVVRHRQHRRRCPTKR